MVWIALSYLSISQVTAPTEVMKLPLRIIHVLDSSGQAEFFGGVRTVMTWQIAVNQLSAINYIFRPTGIQFTLEPNDFQVMKDDYLNLDCDYPGTVFVATPQTEKPKATGVTEHNKAFQTLSNTRQDRLTVIVHRGSEWRWNAKRNGWEFSIGFSHGGPGLKPGRGAYVLISGTSPRVWAHEFAHSLGLPHTCKDGVHAPSTLRTEEDITRACQSFLDKGGDPYHPELAIDGDAQAGVIDTPPDPGLGFWEGKRTLEEYINITLPGQSTRRILVSRNNIMHARADNGGFTPGQIAVMRSRLQRWLGENLAR